MKTRASKHLVHGDGRKSEPLMRTDLGLFGFISNSVMKGNMAQSKYISIYGVI